LLKCEDLNYGSVCSKCLRYQIISYSPLVALTNSQIESMLFAVMRAVKGLR